MTKFPKKTAQGKEGGWDRKSCAKCHGHLTATKGDDQSVDDVSESQLWKSQLWEMMIRSRCLAAALRPPDPIIAAAQT